MMAVITGMRKGEIIALRWSDIDLERRVLRVLHTVDYIPGYGYVEHEPKTPAGKRTIDLPEFFIDMLKHHRAKQVERRLKVGEVWENRDLVFPDLTGGYLIPTRVLRDTSKMREVGHRTEALWIGFQLIKSVTDLVNHLIERDSSFRYRQRGE